MDVHGAYRKPSSISYPKSTDRNRHSETRSFPYNETSKQNKRKIWKRKLSLSRRIFQQFSQPGVAIKVQNVGNLLPNQFQNCFFTRALFFLWAQNETSAIIVTLEFFGEIFFPSELSSANETQELVLSKLGLGRDLE